MMRGEASRDVLATKVGSGKLKVYMPIAPVSYKTLVSCSKILAWKEAHFQACFEGPTGNFPCVPMAIKPLGEAQP